MTRLNLRRAYTRLVSDTIPEALARIRIGKFQYKVHQPSGRERPARANFSLAVPFNYAVANNTKRGTVAVVCHLFHANLSGWLLQALQQSGLSGDLYISTDTAEKAGIIKNVLSEWKGGATEIRVVENRGRDIAPKLITFADIYDRYDLVLFLHSKRSSHFDFGNAWREHLVRCLAGSPAVVDSIMEIFARCPKIGMVVPQHFGPLWAIMQIAWGKNFRTARQLAWRMDIDLEARGYLDMPSGSMFWARPEALRPLIDLQLDFQDFPPEPCPVDGTIAHAIERLFLFGCEKSGYDWVKVTEVTDDPTAVEITSPSEISGFIARHGFHLLGRGGRHR